MKEMTNARTNQWFYGYLMYVLVTCFSLGMFNSGFTNEIPGWLYVLSILSVGFAIGKAHDLLLVIISIKNENSVSEVSKTTHDATHADYIDSTIVERK